MPSDGQDIQSPAPAVRPLRAADSPFLSFKPFQPLQQNMPEPEQKENTTKQPSLLQSALMGNAGSGGGRGVAQRPPQLLAKLSAHDLATMSTEELTAAANGLSVKQMQEREKAVAKLDAVERAQRDKALREKQKIERALAVAEKVKRPTPPSNIFLGVAAATPEPQKSLAAPDWEALPVGTVIRVWWEGNNEAFECTILDWHVAVGADGHFFYTHRCEYESGTFDHDLSSCAFEVIEFPIKEGDEPAAPSSALSLSARAESGATPKNPGLTDDLTPKRRWLARQEAQLAQFSEDLEQADIGTPAHPEEGLARGRLVLRRMRQPVVFADGAPPPGKALPQTPRQADGTVAIVDPSNKAVTYRKPVATPAISTLR